MFFFRCYFYVCVWPLWASIVLELGGMTLSIWVTWELLCGLGTVTRDNTDIVLSSKWVIFLGGGATCVKQSYQRDCILCGSFRVHPTRNLYLKTKETQNVDIITTKNKGRVPPKMQLKTPPKQTFPFCMKKKKNTLRVEKETAVVCCTFLVCSVCCH